VSRASAAERAMPKSVTTQRPRVSTSTLSGFTSRCTTPSACAYPSARAVSAITRRTRAGGSGPSRASSAESERPRTSCMVKKLTGATRPTR
jgi:hypothetical protein